MRIDPRIYVLFTANALLFILSMLVNSRLAPFSLYLILFGLMLILPAIYFKYTSLIVCSFISGLFVDALLPQPYWLFAYGFPVVSLFIRSIRRHFRTETSYRFVSLAHIANSLCILLLCLGQMVYLHRFAVGIPVLTILLLSHLVLPLLAPWFFNFERSLLQILNVDHPHEEEFSVL